MWLEEGEGFVGLGDTEVRPQAEPRRDRSSVGCVVRGSWGRGAEAGRAGVVIIFML